jgi:hypothetical protein
MDKLINPNLIFGTLFFLTSCATSMLPMKVNDNLPNLTEAKFISQSQAEEAVKANKCKYLVKGREYVAPMALTVKGDLRNGAKGIDEWVNIDGGNTYVLVSYKWVTVDDEGTQLYIEFDTMLCE